MILAGAWCLCSPLQNGVVYLLTARNRAVATCYEGELDVEYEGRYNFVTGDGCIHSWPTSGKLNSVLRTEVVVTVQSLKDDRIIEEYKGKELRYSESASSKAEERSSDQDDYTEDTQEDEDASGEADAAIEESREGNYEKMNGTAKEHTEDWTEQNGYYDQEEPVEQEPVEEEPVEEEPVEEDPVEEDPVEEDPVEEDPGNEEHEYPSASYDSEIRNLDPDQPYEYRAENDTQELEDALREQPEDGAEEYSRYDVSPIESPMLQDSSFETTEDKPHTFGVSDENGDGQSYEEGDSTENAYQPDSGESQYQEEVNYQSVEGTDDTFNDLNESERRTYGYNHGYGNEY